MAVSRYVRRGQEPPSPKTLARILRLAKRDGGLRCAYCKCELDADLFILEHVVPRSRGGPDDDSNRVLSCNVCDDAKKNRTPQEWKPGVIFGNPIVDLPPKKRRKRHAKSLGLQAPPRASVSMPRPRIPPPAKKKKYPPSPPKPKPPLVVDLCYCSTCSRVVDRSSHGWGHVFLDDPSAPF